MANFTLDDFNKKVMEPAVQKLEQKLGKTSQEIIKDCDKELAMSRKILKKAREGALKNG